jgi:hypothetical protein
VTQSLVPIDPVGPSLLHCCSSSFVLASALLPSLSSLVPKVSREVCVCFRLFVCDSQSCDWDIGRVLLRKNFYRLPFTPPSLVANPVLQQSAHETAHRCGEAALMVLDEADDVAVRRVGLPIRRQRNDPCQGLPIHVRRQLTAVHELAQGESRHRRADPRQCI